MVNSNFQAMEQCQLNSAHRLKIAVLAALIPLCALAGDEPETIRGSLEKHNPRIRIQSIQPSPLPGIYEIYANGQMLYVDKTGQYVLAGGNLFENASKRNLTAERLAELSTIQFDTLPLQNAIEIRKGNGAYKFAVFSDPDCPYCKTLEQRLDKQGLTDYTAYIFLYPLEELHQDARSKAEAIWCTQDRGTAWNAWMKSGKLPEKASCENPINANKKLGESLGVNATPTIYLNNGKQASSPEELVAALKQKQ